MGKVQPAAYRAMSALDEYNKTSLIGNIQREMIKIRASQINGCAYCVNIHTRDARKLGETEQRIYLMSVWREAGAIFTEEEQLLLAMTEEITLILYHSDEKRKVSYLAEEFNMTKATISDTIKTLEQKKLITKEYELQDTRSYIIYLTKKGKDIAYKTALFTKEIRSPIDKLHRDEKENMLLNLFDIIRHLNKSGVITIQRMCTTCSYYQPSEKGQKHFCKLLNQNLHVTDLRIDCPEHEIKI